MKLVRNIHHMILVVTAVVAFGMTVSTNAYSKDYPSKPITAIVPFGAGGGTDNYARTLASSAVEVLGQPIVVVNRPGGGGYLGAKFAADARKDGHTILFQSGGSFILGGMMQRRPVDPFQDFEPVAIVGQVNTGLIVSKNSPYETIQDLIESARTNRLTWAHSGRGGVHHMAGAAFQNIQAFNAKDVPYKGGGNVRTAVMGGQVDFAWAGVQQIAGFESELRVLGVANKERDPVQNDFKTFEEIGVDYARFASPVTIYVPKGTDQELIDRLSSQIQDILAQESFKTKASAAGLPIMYMGPEQTKDYLKTLAEEWEPIVEKVKTELSKS